MLITLCLLFIFVINYFYLRFLHYLPATSMGLSKEDFSLLAKSSLAPKEIIKKETNRNNDIFSDDILDPFWTHILKKKTTKIVHSKIYIISYMKLFT